MARTIMSSGSSTTLAASMPRSGTRCSALQPSATPFMRHEYLLGAARIGQRVADTGWAPQFLTSSTTRAPRARRRLPALPQEPLLRRVRVRLGLGRRLRAPRPGLLPEAALRGAVHAGARPAVAGTRRRAAGRAAARDRASRAQNEPLVGPPAVPRRGRPARRARAAGWMLRSTVQFHWTNREPQPYADFAEFLASLQREKRKKIQQERR